MVGKIALFLMFFLIIAGLVATFQRTCVGQPPTTATAQPIVLETEFLRWSIDGSGKTVEFVDKSSGKNYSVSPRPVVAIRQEGRDRVPSSCELKKDQLIFHFAEPPAKLTVQVIRRLGYLVFELASYQGPPAERITFVALRPALNKSANHMAGLISDGEFSCCLRVQDYRIGFNLVPGNEPLLQAVWYPEYTGGQLPPIKAAGREVRPNSAQLPIRAAVVACPAKEIRRQLQQMILAEQMLSSLVGGPFALDAPETRGSYVFANVTAANVDQWIALCKRAGIDLIHMIGWDQSYGHYRPREQAFPGGMPGLRAVVKKIHEAGLKAGIHVHFGISADDPFVSPVPDPRLGVDARFELAQAVDEKAEFLPTTTEPKDLDTVWAYGGRGNVVRIGEELIQYHELSADPPGFARCRRGVFGTRAAPHNQGDAVEHLYVRYNVFYPDENTDLVEAIAEHVAEVVNECELDLVYMDGAEGMPGGWYGVSRMRAEMFRRFKGRVMVEASEWGYHSWGFHSRIGAWDYPNWGLKPFIDIHCAANEQFRSSGLIPAQLGWWAILGPSPDTYAELPDEIEYLCLKSLAWDMPMSFQGIDLGEPPNGRQDEYLDMIGRYERLRLARHFPEEILENLRVPGAEFHLRQGAIRAWELVPREYWTQKIQDLGGEIGEWSVNNRFASQPSNLRIRTLEQAAPYESAEAITLTEFREGSWSTQSAANVTCSLSAVSGPEAAPFAHAARLAARSTAPQRRGAWASVTTTFKPAFNLSKMGAIGVWIHGDGKGELLNFQLGNPSYYWPTYAEHYVKVDFTGWRYFELHFKERDSQQHGQYSWPYQYYYGIYRNPLIRHEVNQLTIYVNEVPPGEEIACLIGPIRALPVRTITLRNPTISCGDLSVQFPVELPSGHYLEWFPPEPAKHFDARGKLLGTVQFEGEVPIVNPGENRIRFTCEIADGGPRRAEVTLILEGEPLK